MTPMKPNFRLILMLIAALVVAGAIFRQEREISRLRTAIAELNLASNGAAISTATNPLPAESEERPRDTAEVYRLRAEVAQLRREKLESAALVAKIDKLGADLSAIHGYPNRASESAAVSNYFNPEEAVHSVTAMPPGVEQNQAALAVIDHWAGADPAATAAWTAGFPEGPLREQALSLVARQWGLKDWNATSSWLETLPAGSSRDAAIGSFVTSADGYDIKLALEWANRMEDPDNRAQRVEETARRWLRENNAAARSWIQNAQLPSGMAEQLLSSK